jgi:hypothetical protein
MLNELRHVVESSGHPYTYAGNNPTSLWDPSGLCDNIPVWITDNNGRNSTTWSVCDEGSTSPFDQILDLAAGIGVGSGAAAWNAGGQPQGKGLQGPELGTVDNVIKRLLNSNDEACVRAGVAAFSEVA